VYPLKVVPAERVSEVAESVNAGAPKVTVNSKVAVAVPEVFVAVIV
jgi:hypothetical protein